MASVPEHYALCEMANHCLAERHHRRAATLLWEAFRKCPSSWTCGRYNMFSMYVSALSEDTSSKPTRKDLKNLQSVLDDEMELKIFRVAAGQALGLFYGSVFHEHEDAADFFRQAISLADAVSERELKECNAHSISNDGSDIRNTLGELRSNCKANLNAMENPAMHRFRVGEPPNLPSTFHQRSDGTIAETKPYLMDLPSNDPNRAKVGGSDCDHCLKTLAELAIPRLSICTRCKMAYYCSKECQKAAWRKGHKVACRAPDQRERGDLMRLLPLGTEEEHVSKLVTLVEQLANGQWQVKLTTAPHETLIVDSDRLAHIRPDK
ncbi:hypothetical protein MPSEU_000225600 [Mayamaea pseudoterrestris]|nr:hypothetical protein MPSEU_000225600 [Mayamaea pseudoterrestris]